MDAKTLNSSSPVTSWSRRIFLQSFSAAVGSLALGAFGPPKCLAATSKSSVGVADLPEGAAPAPLEVPYFPSRVHACVWRNWPLVPVERLAKVLRAPQAEVIRMGKAMGLGKPPRIPSSIQARSYITVIRRNWHLLPYEQLLELLGWTPEEMAYTLREDDFLYIKLGNLKPACVSVYYQKPTEAMLLREREIRAIMQSELPGLSEPAPEPLFGFLDDLSEGKAGNFRSTDPQAPLRFCYSYFALYGDPLLDAERDPYPNGYLARLASIGVNGVWLQAVLYKLALFQWEPGLSQGYEIRLKNLAKLVSRASRHGIRVFLYLNEPRAMPLQFFESHPDLKGAPEGEHAALCTSHPAVKEFLTKAVASICRAVPDLGGFFTITASENLSNCWSHGGGAKCPRCSKRTAPEVIAEANSLFWQGIQQAGTKTRLIAWDWGWADAWASEAITRLPRGISFMSVSEWRLPIERGGVKTEVGEYSISAVGPGPRAMRHWEIARERGLACVAKVQAGNTWELSSVPYIPAVANVARHAENLHRAGVPHQMLGWTLGGYPSPNVEVVDAVGATGSATEGLRRVANRRFGPALSPMVIKAWQQFSEAFSEFPYHGGVVYNGSQQMGPANPLWSKPTGYRATMVGFPYDDLNGWRAVYPVEVFLSQLEKVAQGFATAFETLKAESDRVSCTKRERQNLAAELRVAEAVMIHFRSTANQVRFVQERAKRAESGSPYDGVSAHTMQEILRDEIRLAKRLFELQRNDSRLGFEASNHYFFVPVDLAEKVLNCYHLLNTRSLPNQRR